MALDIYYLFSRLRLLSDQERRDKLEQLLGYFPTDWLVTASDVISQELRRRTGQSNPGLRSFQ